MLKLSNDYLHVESTANHPQERVQGRVEVWVLLALMAYFVLGASYFIVRAGGYWAENDTAHQTLAIWAIGDSGELIPETSTKYLNGYGYAVVSNVLLAFTGLNVLTLQQLVYPILSAFLVLLAWALYRELTGSRRGAAIATSLLLLQPEFLFVVFRGSHERVLRGLMFASLWLLARSFRFRDRPSHFAVHIALFYMAAFSLIATNDLFGLSFIFAIASAMVIAWVVGRTRANQIPLASSTAGRLAWVTLTTAFLGFVFVFYVYPPAIHGLQALNGMLQKLAALFLATASTQAGENPYAQVTAAWTSLPAYFLVSMSNFLLMAISVPIWLWQGLRWLRGAERIPAVGTWLLWLLYGAFAFQGALAIVSDVTGLMGGNLQHRSFPSFAMVATPLLATALAQYRPRVWGKIAAGSFLALLAVLALVKATNEPSLSNKWTFYTAAEQHTLEWADEHETYAAIWVGVEERLTSGFLLASGRSMRHNEWDMDVPNARTRMFVISDIIRLQSVRLNRPLPPIAGANVIYDSGTTQVYRLVSQTPYQR